MRQILDYYLTLGAKKTTATPHFLEIAFYLWHKQPMTRTKLY